MTRGSPARAALLAALLAVALPVRAGAGARHPLLPDQAKLQFAGTLGLVSAGGGWAFAGRRLELDLLLGWVPPSMAGVHLVALTGKLTWLPFEVSMARWRLRPVTLALAATHTFGDGFWLRLPSRYPPRYYPIATALRWSVAAGGLLGRRIGGFEHVGLYWEVVAVDLPLVHWARNPEAVRASDVLSLALGVRASF
jgi:hypothetical protein